MNGQRSLTRLQILLKSLLTMCPPHPSFFQPQRNPHDPSHPTSNAQVSSVSSPSPMPSQTSFANTSLCNGPKTPQCQTVPSLFKKAQLTPEIHFNSESPSEQNERLHSDSHPASMSAQSRSLEENHHNYIHARKKSLSRNIERAPSPATQINQLRKVLAGTPAHHTSTVPNIEVNGEKFVSDATPEEDLEMDEKAEGDLNVILDSLNVNGTWNEKFRDLNGKGNESGIKPPAEI